jgi:anti-anti-sigma factor
MIPPHAAASIAMPIQHWSDRIWVVSLSDEPALSEDLNAVKDESSRVKPHPDVVIDMSGLSHINSSNLSQLLRLRKASADSGTRLRLAGVPDVLWVVFLTTGLDKVFEFAEDVPSALAGLQIETKE